MWRKAARSVAKRKTNIEGNGIKEKKVKKWGKEKEMGKII